MSNLQFFDERTESSRVKAQIVWKYFSAWAKVMMGVQNRGKTKIDNRLGYVDLFAGPGVYQDGSISTPVLIMKEVVNTQSLADRVMAVFNDMQTDYIDSLQNTIESLYRVEYLKYEPVFLNAPVDQNIVKALGSIVGIPTLYFLDPFGYKDTPASLVANLIKGFGCDILLFFNYNRFNQDINNHNSAIEQYVQALLGNLQLSELRASLVGLSPSDRESTIVLAVQRALIDAGATYVIHFAFSDEDANRTSHYIFHLTKHPKGQEIVKDIMHGYSSESIQGIGTYRFKSTDQYSFELDTPLDDLADDLHRTFLNRTLPVAEIIHQHSPNSNYIKKHYRSALKSLEKDKRISTIPSPTEISKDTMPDRVIVTFVERDKD